MAGRRKRTEPPPVYNGNVLYERCYCWALHLPHVHALLDHRINQEKGTT